MIHSYSRLTQKLSRRFLFIYTILFVFLSVIILIGSVCLLFFQTRQTAENQLSLAAESITSYQKELRDKTYLLTASHELAEMIKIINSIRPMKIMKKSIFIFQIFRPVIPCCVSSV